MNNYIVLKKEHTEEITFINYEKIDGYKISPKNKIDYDGIKINSILIIKPSLIEKVLKRKNKIKLAKYLDFITDEADDDDSSTLREALDNISRYKDIIEYKYRKYLDDRYINLLNKKVDLLERKIKTKLIYKELSYEPKQEKITKAR